MCSKLEKSWISIVPGTLFLKNKMHNFFAIENSEKSQEYPGIDKWNLPTFFKFFLKKK